MIGYTQTGSVGMANNDIWSTTLIIDQGPFSRLCPFYDSHKEYEPEKVEKLAAKKL